MSVIIKGMDMPIDCLACRIACDKENFGVIGRPPKCPLEEVQDESSGVYQCFHCGSQSVVWQSDFSFEDYGLEGEGIINVCHCTNCGAHIEYYISLEEDDENETESVRTQNLRDDGLQDVQEDGRQQTRQGR